eukprot:357204-Chlamydomonas_euryale.AAC.5
MHDTVWNGVRHGMARHGMAWDGTLHGHEDGMAWHGALCGVNYTLCLAHFTTDCAVPRPDLQLVFDNALTYNPPANPVHTQAQKLQAAAARYTMQVCKGFSGLAGAPASYEGGGS